MIGTDDGTWKGYGLEILARDMVVTDNVVNRGSHIGLSVSIKAVKNNVFWGYNTIRDCIQWGVQLQGETGGIARHYFYRCTFSNTIRGARRATYPDDSGHGFRTNGNCRELVCEECTFAKNGGYGIQLGGEEVDSITFLRSSIERNGPAGDDRAFSIHGSGIRRLQSRREPGRQVDRGQAISGAGTHGRLPLAGCHSGWQRGRGSSAYQKPAAGEIVERLWDFSDGIPETTSAPEHIFEWPGSYRVTLIVWDRAGRGGRAEKTIRVLPQ